jgi:hypothetical protein
MLNLVKHSKYKGVNTEHTALRKLIPIYISTIVCQLLLQHFTFQRLNSFFFWECRDWILSTKTSNFWYRVEIHRKKWPKVFFHPQKSDFFHSKQNEFRFCSGRESRECRGIGDGRRAHQLHQDPQFDELWWTQRRRRRSPAVPWRREGDGHWLPNRQARSWRRWRRARQGQAATGPGSQVAPSATGLTRNSGDEAGLAGGALGDGPSGGMRIGGGRSRLGGERRLPLGSRDESCADNPW